MSINPDPNSGVTDEQHQENLEVARWRREWERDGRPEHSCLQEQVVLPGTLRAACGVCGAVFDL